MAASYFFAVKSLVWLKRFQVGQTPGFIRIRDFSPSRDSTKIDTVRYTCLSNTGSIYYVPYTALHYIPPPSLDSDSNHAEELHGLWHHSIAGSPTPVLRCLPVRHVLFQSLSEDRLEEAAQANLQASQRWA
jgi:hypothetical protein